MIALPAVLLLLQAAPPPAPPVEVRAPPAWVPIESPPLQAYAPPDLRRGEMLLFVVFPAERLSTPDGFASWFQGKLSGPGERVLQQSPIDRRPAAGHVALTATQRVVLPQGGQFVRVVYGISAGDRAAVAMVTSNRDDLVTRHAEAIRVALESLRLPEAAPPVAIAPQPLPARPANPPGAGTRTAIPPAGFEGGEPRGLFYRLQVALGSASMETQTRIFLPSRRVLRTFPFGGGDGIDLSRCNPDMCGDFRLEGSALVIRWDTGETQRLAFARSEDGGLTLDGDAFRPARGLPQAELVGRWVKPGTGAVPLNTGLRLEPDGTFEWGAGGASTLRGRYRLEGLAIALDFADGTSKAYTLFAASRSRPAGLISFDGSVYARQ